MIEELQTAWESKCDNPCFAMYRSAIKDGLVKLNKYYSRFDEKPAYILSLGMLLVITTIFFSDIDLQYYILISS